MVNNFWCKTFKEDCIVITITKIFCSMIFRSIFKDIIFFFKKLVNLLIKRFAW